MQNPDYDVNHKPVSVLTMENVITIPARMWLTHSLTHTKLIELTEKTDKSSIAKIREKGGC
jgi:hydroxyacyl-ACP dehydratase HTD2-like protein with hotdog domain